MTWQTTITQLVRLLINDLDADLYSSATIQSFIAGSAQLVKNEINFDNTYTISVTTPSISPDPTSTSDDNFINIVSLKTACLILAGEVKTAAASALKVVDGPSSIDASSSYKAKKEWYDKVLEEYNRAVAQHKTGNSVGGIAILGPFSLYNRGGTWP